MQNQLTESNLTESEYHIQNWEYRIRDFIYIATRYAVEAVHKTVRPGLVFSAFFQDHVLNARTLYELFKSALRKDLIEGNYNLDFYGRDIRARFLPMIGNYEQWYNQHKEETKIFGVYNPYELMWNVAESTRDEILKYFPDQLVSSNYKPTSSRVHEESSYKSFEELFNSPNELETCVKILKDVAQYNKHSVIDDAGKWIGKKGGISILIAWIEVLTERGKFRTSVTSLQMAELLNKYFFGLNLDTKDASIWRKITTVRNRYHADFLQHIK